ncbi:ABC transporter ATP-binding protein [Thermaerobacter subterraneus]|uniref:Amino acid/amide ABC transporter ATP-binding protein 1, HAAT family n=1 Tax=Thermaerobacter subterraneus DSM 13965 TaxID=867903 RepID=K6Q2Q4_9FIRM|nr:ABC transporter ATP-binding protein [Thermaerobacter subterraneus]EKP95319.1 amino acid/amide ABC transporter ATP-binding protein 1, HAAT family [Thermaerobacter subterraneus DSM 13965]
MPLLELDGVAMVFGGLTALHDLHLRVEPGELVGIIGPNGAGKTTVFNVITGVYRPTRGRIRFLDADLTGLPPAEITRRGIARTFQNIRLFPELTVLDNILVAHHFRAGYGLLQAVFRGPRFAAEERRMRDEAMELLRLVRLEGRAGQPAGSLPYGEQRRLEIARALATRPRLLLLDEPAAGMNPAEGRELMQFIRWIRERFDLTILLIEHHMPVVMGVCQRIVVLNFGRVIAEGTPDQIRTNPQVIEAYLGEQEEAG